METSTAPSVTFVTGEARSGKTTLVKDALAESPSGTLFVLVGGSGLEESSIVRGANVSQLWLKASARRDVELVAFKLVISAFA